MKTTTSRLVRYCLVAGIGAMLCYSCGEVPLSVAPNQQGSVAVQTIVVNRLAKQRSQMATLFDSLVVEVDGSGMEPIRYARSLAAGDLFAVDTIPHIPAGDNRTIRVYTSNIAGKVVHEDSLGVRKLRIEQNVTLQLQVVLIPACGSLYLQVGSVPTTIDSLWATFVAKDGTAWTTHVARKPKIALSIDGIPHATEGKLYVAGVTIAGDTLVCAETTLVFSAHSNNALQLNFQSAPGGLVLNCTLVLPGATIVSASMGEAPVAVTESGELLITELMYAADDSEYIEIYNPAINPVQYDSLVVNIDGKSRLFTNVTVGAGGYFVFGRELFPWVNATHAVQSALDLSSTGNWITLLTTDGAVIDQVVFAGGSNDLEWPKVRGKQSIYLQKEGYSATLNNFGRYWRAAETVLNGTDAQWGTPHAL